MEHTVALIAIENVCRAVQNMSKHCVGALVIFRRQKELNAYDEMKSVNLNSDITSELIENIFFKNSPLHDGAVVISDFRISKARVLFDEISNNPLLPLDLGSRHKAGVGATEGDNDCIAVMVSEETGHISYAIDGELKRAVTTDALYTMLRKNLIVENDDDKQKNREQISTNK